jgi:hypothetical protein
MATTPNFSWPTPDNTDLVKNGALAIRTLGDAIDASLVDLEGGTTDQVLAKNSNTDMDFKWVTSDDANAIQNAIVDAKGDLIAATAADTPARLAVGGNNLVLTADSSTATGLKYSADWTSYTPTWAASGTAPSLGNGTLTGNYLQVGKQVIVRIAFIAGSTTTFGTGNWSFTLPFNPGISTAANGLPGGAYIEDLSVAGYQVVSMAFGNPNKIFPLISSASAIGPTTPMTWANGDYMNLTTVYGVA